ncbi:MAG: hypothetical protein ACRDN0_04200 [Trebonia sp.]
MRIGYARASTARQPLDTQADALRQQLQLIANERPVLDQLVLVQHTRHGGGPSADRHYCHHPTNPPRY